jgi:hypothetical protein
LVPSKWQADGDEKFALIKKLSETEISAEILAPELEQARCKLNNFK